MKYFSYLFGILIVGLIGYGAYYFYNETYEQTISELQNSPDIIPTAPPITEASPSAKVASSSAIPKDWKKYTSAKYGYSFYYPQTMKTDTMAEGDRFYWFGKTQSLGTELYDGISLLIKSGFLQNKTLQQFVKDQHDSLAKEETTQSITEITPVNFGQIKGFKFRKSSLGEGDFIYIQKNKDEYLEIINMTVQPKKSTEEKYQDVVDQMISSVTFN